MASAFGYLASTERQDPGERFECRTKARHLGEYSLRTTDHPTGVNVVLRLMPRTDQTAFRIDAAVREVGAEVPTPAADREVLTVAFAYGKRPRANHLSRRESTGRSQRVLLAHADTLTPGPWCNQRDGESHRGWVSYCSPAAPGPNDLAAVAAN